MCGRSRCALAPEEVSTSAGIPQERWRDKHKYQPRNNLTPGGWIPVIKRSEADQQTELQSMRYAAPLLALHSVCC